MGRGGADKRGRGEEGVDRWKEERRIEREPNLYMYILTNIQVGMN